MHYLHTCSWLIFCILGGFPVSTCLKELKIQGETGNLAYAGSSSPHIIQLALKDGTNLQGTLCNSARNTPYLCTLSFATGLAAGSRCVEMNDIEEVSLIANGNDGWYIASISTYVKTSSSQYVLLTKNETFNKWLDGNQNYPYDAKKHVLTFAFCLTELKIEGQTGNLAYAGSSSPHEIQLTLDNGTELQGTVCHSTRNTPYLCTLSFATGLHAGRMCVKKSDIQEVNLIANGNDGWFIASISTFVKTSASEYMVLTEDDSFNRWLDGDQNYPYNATKHMLNLGSEDTPYCGYGHPACICNPNATTCIFNLEIDEIVTFTSYQKLPISNGGLYIRGIQGVSYFIEEDGTSTSHKAYNSRQCSSSNFNSSKCTDPQYVDGKTFRTALGVNGQIPGPTLVVHDQQMVVIHVHNNLSTDGISIHWHGMHQRNTPWMDGVGQVSHCQIGPASTFSYMYKASPSGTFWYHSHTGTQRTDGFFGGLIVKEKPETLAQIKTELSQYGVGNFEDYPDRHTLALHDWELEANFDRLSAGLGFYPQAKEGQVPDDTHERYSSTKSYEKAGVGPIPFFSGLINGKGRHNEVPYAKTRLSVFTVNKGNRYRFRLIGAQGLYAFKFSIDGHKLTVVATDGYWTQPVKDVDFIIIHTGERYDFILDANQPIKNYWMRAETLEINTESHGPPYKSLNHVAEGILQYIPSEETEAPEIPSNHYDCIKVSSPPITCTSEQQCKAVNCPFISFQEKYYTTCVNVHQMKLLIPTPTNELPKAYPTCLNNCRHFINFNFEGISKTSSVNGRNFVLPPAPPQTQHEDFLEQAIQCDPDADCNPSTTSCLCTYVIDLPCQQTVQLVLSGIGPFDNSHPIHIHGHTFHVVKVGYPEYDSNTGFIKKVNDSSVHNSDIECADSSCTNDGCDNRRCTKPSWSNSTPNITIDRYTIRKDTVMIPAGGYVVVNFITDNPGFWFLHCHIEVHQLEGMALILSEGITEQSNLKPPPNMNRCGHFALTMGEFEQKYDSPLPLQQNFTLH